jgi:glycerophosphoryl diester phosphodiesterase
LISSSSASALVAAAAIWPAAPLALVAGRLPRGWRAVLARLGARRIHLRDRWLGKRRFAMLARAGIAVGVYTVNDAARARRLAAFGVAAIFTDRPGDMRGALGEGG